MGIYVEPRNVSMYPRDWEIIDCEAKRLDLTSTSAALRVIVREWRRMKDEESSSEQS